MTPLAPSLTFGEVGHTRLRPKRHSLRYGMFSVLLDIDGEHSPQQASPLFSVDRFNLTSFYQRDHGRGEAELRPWVQEQLLGQGNRFALGRIQILAAPRVLGLVFNPVTVIFCHDKADQLRALIFQVSNFHGGRYAYTFVLPANDGPGSESGSLRFTSRKRFYVSPFNSTEGEYRFRLDRSEEAIRLGIQLFRDDECVLSAVHLAHLRALDTGNLLIAHLKFPLNTVRIVGAILFEAVRLRLKGLKLYTPRHDSIDTQPWRQ